MSLECTVVGYSTRTGRGDYGSDFSLNEIAVVAREANGEYNQEVVTDLKMHSIEDHQSEYIVRIWADGSDFNDNNKPAPNTYSIPDTSIH